MSKTIWLSIEKLKDGHYLINPLSGDKVVCDTFVDLCEELRQRFKEEDTHASPES